MSDTAATPHPATQRPVQHIRMGALQLQFLIDGPSSGASLTMFELTVPPNAKVPALHSHDAFDETLYGLEGVLTSTRGEETLQIEPGDTVFIPRGVVHGFSNPFSETARVLAVITPPLLGIRFFQELAALVETNPNGPPDREAMNEVLRRYGLTPAS